MWIQAERFLNSFDGSGRLPIVCQKLGLHRPGVGMVRIQLQRGGILCIRFRPASLISQQKTEDPTATRVIRVERDSTQRLWSFDLTGGDPRLVLERIKPVGYHAWVDPTTLALFVLGSPNSLQIADLGTGSGAILAAVLKELPNAAGIGFEASADAFVWAQGNVARLIGARAQIQQADWWQAQGPFDLVFSNPPYIPTGEIESLVPDVSQFEPRTALDGGSDGLDAYRALAELLPGLLKPGGHALLEIGLGQANSVTALFQELEIVRVAPDLSGIPRCLTLRKP